MMNSLVVLLSVVAFAAAKPSEVYDAGLLTYSSPIVAAAPAAVSSQARLDIKSSPAVISTEIQPASRTVIAEPSFLNAPVIAAPTAYTAPAAYSAPVAIATPAAVSHQSRLDIKTSPAITSTVVSAPVAYSASIAAPTAYAAPAAYATPAVYAAPAAYAAPDAYATSVAYGTPAFVATPSAVSHQSRLDIKSSPAITSTVVSAPIAYSATGSIEPTFVKTAFSTPAFSSAFIKSATIVPSAIGAPAVPLDTPEVVAARAAHFEAKAQAEGHLIRKRSVLATPFLSTHLANPVISTYAATPVVSTYSAPIYSAPLSYSAAISTPIVTKVYGIHSW